MPLSEDDVREILRLIDESDTQELHIESGELSLHGVRGDGQVAPEAEASPSAAPEPPPPDPTAAVEAPHAVEAPMLGTFYRAPAPGAAPFVDVGARVEPGTVVCLIEVMKMMNPVSAGVAGAVVEVCDDTGEIVEVGAVLFHVQAD